MTTHTSWSTCVRGIIIICHFLIPGLDNMSIVSFPSGGKDILSHKIERALLGCPVRIVSKDALLSIVLCHLSQFFTPLLQNGQTKREPLLQRTHKTKHTLWICGKKKKRNKRSIYWPAQAHYYYTQWEFGEFFKRGRGQGYRAPKKRKSQYIKWSNDRRRGNSVTPNWIATSTDLPLTNTWHIFLWTMHA